MDDRIPVKEFARKLRNNPTSAENALWQELRGSKTGYKFRRQHPIDERTIVDFYCPSAKVIVELDGDSHQHKQEDLDPARDKRLEGEGFLVLRFGNDEVLQHPERARDNRKRVQRKTQAKILRFSEL